MPDTAIRKATYDNLPVTIFPDKQTMGVAVADRAAEILCTALNHKPSANLILATGNSMLNFLTALCDHSEVDWKRVNIFHMDEYLGMPETHPASFRRYIREKVVDIVHPRAFFGVNADAPDPNVECQRYEGLLREYPADLCCLGIGENGHLAFNDPPVADFDDPVWVKVVELDLACRMQQVGEGHFKSLDEVPRQAITLTIPALLSAANVVVIAPEKRKAVAVKNALTGAISTACPASILRKMHHSELFLDHDSASLL